MSCAIAKRDYDALTCPICSADFALCLCRCSFHFCALLHELLRGVGAVPNFYFFFFSALGKMRVPNKANFTVRAPEEKRKEAGAKNKREKAAARHVCRSRERAVTRCWHCTLATMATKWPVKPRCRCKTRLCEQTSHALCHFDTNK